MTTRTRRRRRRPTDQLDLFTPAELGEPVEPTAPVEPDEPETGFVCPCGAPAIARILIPRDLLRTPYAAPRAREEYRAEHGEWYPLTASIEACATHLDYYAGIRPLNGLVNVVLIQPPIDRSPS